MSNIYNEETVFYFWKRCSFLLADTGIFIDFFVLEKKKTKMCSFDSCLPNQKRSRETTRKIWLFVHQIKSAKKDKTLLECVVSTSMAKYMLKSVLAVSTDLVVCEGWLKWNHLSCTFLKIYQKLILQTWFWKLVLEIVQNEVYKV